MRFHLSKSRAYQALVFDSLKEGYEAKAVWLILWVIQNSHWLSYHDYLLDLWARLFLVRKLLCSSHKSSSLYKILQAYPRFFYHEACNQAI